MTGNCCSTLSAYEGLVVFRRAQWLTAGPPVQPTTSSTVMVPSSSVSLRDPVTTSPRQ